MGISFQFNEYKYNMKLMLMVVNGYGLKMNATSNE